MIRLRAIILSALVLVSLPIVPANAARRACKPPPAVREMLSVGIVVLVCGNGYASVGGEKASHRSVISKLEEAMQANPDEPLRIATDMLVSDLSEALMQMSLKGPEGSGFFIFNEDSWFGGLNE